MRIEHKARWAAVGWAMGLALFAQEARAAWVEVATLSRPTGLGGDGTSYGSSVACSEGIVLVGAPYEDDYTGAVYAFSGSDFSQVERITAPDPIDDDMVGGRLSISGNTALVGSTRLSGGYVRLFVRENGAWTHQATILPTGAAIEGAFGYTLAVHGDVAVVGAPKESDDTGRVYVYRREGSVWTEEAQLSAGDAAKADFFGLGLAFDGTTILATAPSNAITDSERGAAYLFTRTGTTWSQQARLDLAGHELRPPTIYFGGSVAVHGNRAIVSGTRGTDMPVARRLFVYERRENDWQLASTILSPDPEDKWFASSIALQGERTWAFGGDGDGYTLQEFQHAEESWIPTHAFPPTTGASHTFAVCGELLVSASDSTVIVYRDAALDDEDVTSPRSGTGPDDGDNGGCSCAAAGLPGGSAAAWLSAASLALCAAWGRRRRRCLV